MTRFPKVFQMLTVVLVIAVANVYVFAAPVRSTESNKDDATTETRAEVANIDITTPAAPVKVAAEKLPLAPNAKIDFNRIFSKTEINSRATANRTFFNAKVAGRDTFKAPARTGRAAPQDNDATDADKGAKSTWIAVGIIAAVLTIAVIGLRHDRSERQGSAF